MFVKASTLLRLSLALFGSQALAQLNCLPGDTSLECEICGNPGSSGVTFDDLTIKSTVSSYDGATWTGFTVVHSGPNNPISPTSPTQYARSTTGVGSISWATSDGGLGELHAFYMGCGDPNFKRESKAATACNVTVTVTGVNETGITTGNDYASFIVALPPYTPANTTAAGMMSVDFEGLVEALYLASDINRYFTVNATFEAMMANGKPAFLYLDNVISNTWAFDGPTK